MNTRESIDKTIEELRALIEQAVRDEQLRHPLTGLPNASALEEHVQRAIDGDHPFWLAFVEIDRFKTINAGEGAGLMQCTVSVGWSESSAGTARGLMHDIEIAVAHAKRRGRNRVLKYEDSMRKEPVVSLRSECSGCETSFSFDVPATTHHKSDIYCPNCGTRGPRPAHPMQATAPQDITDLPPVSRST